MYPHREVFPNAPLALVAAEIRFTDAARLRQQQTKDEVTIALEERFPFAEPLQRAEVSLNLIPGGGQPQIQERLGVVLKNASSTETLTIMSESLTYETTTYTSVEKLIEAVTEAIGALASAKVRPALQRVGLRYINELRVSAQFTDVRQWSTWINDRLIGYLEVGPEGVPATGAQSVSTYDLGEGRGLNCRFAALNQGPIVVPEFLKRPAIPSGPFFVLDFDGFQDFSGPDAVPLSAEAVRDSLSTVHVPCGTAFQQSITDEARELFRGTRS
ncbi:MAG TPA: TIGR04255 family protein [Frankiaceae bacterium]|nr:TIGR04255 family protein [Frankiaceae bacterium]